MIYGRDPERALLGTVLDEARASWSGVVVLVGPAGIGKSALVDDTAERAEGMRVVKALSAEAESGLAFAGLHQVLRPILSWLDEIPAPQANALRGALGLAPGDGEDPFLVGAGVLSLLAAAAEDRPLLCIVEDVHWLDAEPVAILLAGRDGSWADLRAARLRRIQLGGIDPAAAAELLRARVEAPIAPAVRRRLVEYGNGNPLVLEELVLALADDQVAGRAPLPDPLPLTARLDVFHSRIEALPEPTQKLLLLAAADNTHDPAVVVRAARKLGIPHETAAQDTAGLLRLDESHVEFRHPLIRSAVYQGASFAQRRAAHGVLAAVLTDESDADRRAWHLAAATSGPDDRVADELERTAQRARARSGHGSAALALARAAALTGDGERRAARQLAAADAATHAGQIQFARTLLDDARALATGPELRADVERLRGVIELENGSPAFAHEILLAGASAIEAVDARRAAAMLVDAAAAARYGGDTLAQVEVARRAERLRPQLQDDFELTAAIAMGRIWETGEAEWRALLENAVAEAAEGGDRRRLLVAASCAIHLGDEATARVLATRAATVARGEGEISILVTALARLAFAEISEGRLASGRANATEGLALAEQMGLENTATYHQALVAWSAALLGHADEAYEHATAALERARPFGRGWQAAVATLALGELELGAGRPAEALAHLELLLVDSSLAGHPYLGVRSIPSFVEAAVLAGRPEDAAAVVPRFERWVAATRSRANAALAARNRALLATDDPTPLFEEALRLHADVDRPFDRGRTEFLFGESLRRTGGRREARAHLHSALELFVRIGAGGWARRAEAGLRASGQRLDRREAPEVLRALTPQELQVARFVARGATNKEVAAQLFLSPRTIDAHLRSIFRKLGLTSRAQLHSLRLGDPDIAA